MESIWWNQVTNAVKYVSDIREALLEEKSILLKYSQGMPWRECFEETVRESVKIQNSEKKFVDIVTTDEPGDYLLNEFCKKEKRAEYRPSKGYAKFFAESDDIVLHDRYLWVQINSEDCLDKWMSFVGDYIKERDKKKNCAVFILEWAGSGNVPVKKGIKSLSFDEYIGEYDRIVFAVLASSSIKDNAFIKSYLAELVSNVTGNDIELAAYCIQYSKQFMENPSAYIRLTVDERLRSDGSHFLYNKNFEEIKHLIWLSQIKIVYPFLEEFREDFVQKHQAALSKQLPIQASYGETYDDPKDVELGTLMYMVGSGHLPLNSSEYEKLKRFKDARNKLSHLSVLDIAEIKALI